jgi:hypothetical protein
MTILWHNIYIYIYIYIYIFINVSVLCGPGHCGRHPTYARVTAFGIFMYTYELQPSALHFSPAYRYAIPVSLAVSVIVGNPRALYVCMCTCMCVGMFVWYVYAYACVCVYVCMILEIYGDPADSTVLASRSVLYVHACMYTFMYKHTYTYIYTL